jgi:hypothetical protein
VAHLALDTRGANEVWKLGEKCVDRRTATDDFHAGVCELAAWAGADNDVIASSRRLFLPSTKRPKWKRKSAPMRGCVTSATTNRHVNSLRNPRLRLRGCHPYVQMVAPLAAQMS